MTLTHLDLTSNYFDQSDGSPKRSTSPRRHGDDLVPLKSVKLSESKIIPDNGTQCAPQHDADTNRNIDQQQSKIWLYRPTHRTIPKLKVLQKWEGTVTEVEDRVITAYIYDKLNPTNGRQEISFYTDEVAPRDHKFISPGAIFYWYIGYRDEINGQRKRESVIDFQRLPAWRSEDIEAVRRKSHPLSELLDDEERRELNKIFERN